MSDNVVVRQLTRGRPHPAASHFLERLKRKMPNWDVATHTQKESCPLARNEAAAQARARKADFFIMLDDDVVPSDGIMRWPLLGLPVIGMLAPCYKQGGFCWNAAELLDKETLRTVRTPMHDPDCPDQMLPVFLIGTAAMLLSKEVLDNQDLWPLFEYDLYPDGTRRPYGAEDYYLCRKLWDCGVPVHMATCLARHFVEIDMVEVLASINAHVVDQNVRPPYLLESSLSEYSMRDGKPFGVRGVNNYWAYRKHFEAAINKEPAEVDVLKPAMVDLDIKELRKNVGRRIRHNA